jgi:hypothetical protein
MYDHMLTKVNTSHLLFEKHDLNEGIHLMHFKFYFGLRSSSEQIWDHATRVITLLQTTWEDDLNEVLHLIDLKS